jgi:phage shock protein A
MKKRKLWGAPAEGVPRDSRFYAVLKAWERAMDDAASAEDALGVLRERVRVARIRAADRARRGNDALAAGQEAFARGLLDAAYAHEVVAREGEASLAEGEQRCAELRARCHALDDDVRREGERYAAATGAQIDYVDLSDVVAA